ncbi:MAG: hypothetical protein E7329_05785 [Clostridiales bacterium]|nr:hypothetical protein [Clostridiales bacterium]
MKKFILAFACVLLLFTASAMAETYTLSDIYASVDIPSDTYEMVLTPRNLSTHSDWLAQQGMDYDAVANSFENEGILLQAYDQENNRTLVISALKNLDAQLYFDLNNQEDAMRKEFRLSHTDGTAYGLLGYSYSSAAWKNYGGDVLRFLQTKYSLRQDGIQVCTGYQRRTIRNGYTITLDMQVTDRAAKEADSTALEKIMKTFSFTKILPMPELPIKLNFTSAPPSETNSDTFTIKGVTGKKATVTATVFSLGASGSETFTDTATNSGSFSIKVTLPSQGVYSVTITSEAENAITAQRMFSVTYQKGLLPVDLTATPGSTLSDTTKIIGSTISGAKTQVSVSGPVNYSKSTTSKNFSFSLDTSAEGTYNIVIAVTKKGLDARTFTYTATRTYSEVERMEKIKDEAKKISYANLKKESNEGKTVGYTGYIASITPSTGEWVIGFAIKRTDGVYKDIIYVISTQEPAFAEGAKVKLYGKATGTYSVLDAEGNIKNYPRVEAYFFETAE